MKLSNILLAAAVNAEGSGEDGDVMTSIFDFWMNLISELDLTLKINQQTYLFQLNDNDSGDNVIFLDLQFNVKDSGIPGAHPGAAVSTEWIVTGKASLADETDLTTDEFTAYAKVLAKKELEIEFGNDVRFSNEQTEKLSCTDGNNGGCSHFCTDNRCSCPNCWSLGIDLKTCHPQDGSVVIACTAESMTLTVDECVLAANSGFKLVDPTCEPQLVDQKWDIETGLDSCGTSFELDAPSQIVTFTNQLIAEPEIKNGLIMSRALAMEFECQYGTSYDDVSNNRTVIGGKVVTSASAQKGTFGTGSLGFSLNFYTSSKFEELVDADTMIMVGETLYFSIEAASVIDGLVATVLDCTVSDPALGAEYDILTGQCPDAFVGTTMNTLSDASMIQFSYTAFQFAGTQGTETQEKLSCSVLVCDGKATSGPCVDEPTCGGRKRREDLEGQLFYVSQHFTLRK